MVTTLPTHNPPGIRLWLKWTLATGTCTLGAVFFAGWILFGTDTCVVAGQSVGLALIIAPVVGVFGGIIQAFILDPQIRRVWWIAASGLAGLTVPFVLGQIGALDFLEAHAGGCSPPAQYANPIASLLIAGGTLGIIFGVSQGLTLRPRFERWVLWIPGVITG